MKGSYIHWGVIQISVTNLVIVVFALAILVPFPAGHVDDEDES